MKSNTLQRLKNHQPLFDSIPSPSSPVIIGTDMELGSTIEVVTAEILSSGNDGLQLPTWLTNGGRMYVDMNHLEVSIPETSNPVAATVYVRACLELARRRYEKDSTGQPVLWYAHNADWLGHTFGCHESYSTTLHQSSWRALCPYLVARTILTGLGSVTKDNRFFLSQRAPYIERIAGNETRYARALICTRKYGEEKGGKPYRLHLICGESNLNQITLFLKFSFTALVIELLEMGELPKMEFNDKGLLEDLDWISSSSEEWIIDRREKDPNFYWLLRSLGKSISAVDLLRLYLEAITRFFKGRDIATDAFIDVADYVLTMKENMEKNLAELSRMSDLEAKLYLLRLWHEEGDEEIPLGAQDMEYHCLGKGWQNDSEQCGGADVVVPSDCIERAIQYAPTDTRAFFRGWLQRSLEEKKNGLELDATIKDWSRCVIMSGPSHYKTVEIPNPFHPGRRQRKRIRRLLR